MAKITSEQKQKLLTYIKLSDPDTAARYLLKYGYLAKAIQGHRYQTLVLIRLDKVVKQLEIDNYLYYFGTDYLTVSEVGTNIFIKVEALQIDDLSEYQFPIPRYVEIDF